MEKVIKLFVSESLTQTFDSHIQHFPSFSITTVISHTLTRRMFGQQASLQTRLIRESRRTGIAVPLFAQKGGIRHLTSQIARLRLELRRTHAKFLFVPVERECKCVATVPSPMHYVRSLAVDNQAVFLWKLSHKTFLEFSGKQTL